MGRRFVGEKDVRLGGERAREQNAGAFAGRQRIDPARGEIFGIGTRERPRDRSLVAQREP